LAVPFRAGRPSASILGQRSAAQGAAGDDQEKSE
jgi:hypothetical protein